MGMASVAQLERAALCDYLEAVGPSRPTLCEGSMQTGRRVIRSKRSDPRSS